MIESRNTAGVGRVKDPVLINGHTATFFDPIVSYFLNHKDTRNPKQAKLRKIFSRIQNGTYKEQVDLVQSLEGLSQRKAKENLPAFTSAGVFSQRRSNALRVSSHVICFDADKGIRDLNVIVDKLKSDPYIWAFHKSARGKGLAIYCRYADNLTYDEAFQALLKYLNAGYDNICDANLKDISRLRFVSHDPDLHINDNAITWEGHSEYGFEDLPDLPFKPNPETSLEDLHARHLNGDNHDPEIFKFISAARTLGFSKKETRDYLVDNDLISPESSLHNNTEKLQSIIEWTYKKYTNEIVREKNTGKSGNSIIVNRFIEKRIQRNEVTNQYEQEGRELTEQEINTELILLQIDNKKAKGLTNQAFQTVLNSSLIPSFHPLKNFIRDNKNRAPKGNIQKLVQSLNLTNKSFKVEVFIRKWLVAMMASIYDDNYNLLMLVLIGPKGCGKTEFFRRLLPYELKRYFAQSKFDREKDSETLMVENLLILNDELDGLHAKQAKAFRNFISAVYYYYRPPYARKNARFKRLASVCGTSNEKSIVTDVEHNRRIIPIEIKGVDHSLYNSIDKTDLLIEAYHLYTQGYDWNLTASEMDELSRISQEHEITSIEFELIQRCFEQDDKGEMTATDIMNHLMNNETKMRLNINKIGSSLKRCGFEQVMQKKGLTTQRIYKVRPVSNFQTTDETDDLL